MPIDAHQPPDKTQMYELWEQQVISVHRQTLLYLLVNHGIQASSLGLKLQCFFQFASYCRDNQLEQRSHMEQVQ